MVLVLLCYWPFTFFISSLSNDNIDVALATKYFAGTCLQNGELPLWNPYQIFGYPAHADLQYTNWNIEVLILGIFNGYDYNTLHLLYLFYLYIGSLGMFLLAKFLSKNQITAFYIGCVFILSGLFTAHSQSLVTILGLVWAPFVFLYFLKWLEAPTLKSSILLALFSYLAFTLGYQAIAFMLLPIFMLLFLIKAFNAFKNKTFQLLKNYTVWGIATCCFILILLSPVLVTQTQSKIFVERLNGLSLEEVMVNPFSPYGLVSLINPILTIGNDEVFLTEITMRNIYMGIIPLILFLVSLFKKHKTKFDYILLFFGVLFLFASFGDYTPVRKILYYCFPGFKLFRFPSLIRVVSIICLLMYLSLNFKFVIQTFFQNKKLRNILLITFLGLSFSVSLFAFKKCPAFTFFNQGGTFNQNVVKSSPYEIAFYYGLIQTSILLSCLFLFNQKSSLKAFCKRLFILTVFELSFTIFIYGQYVAFSPTKPSEIQNNFTKLTSNFPEPSKDPQILNTLKFNYLSVFWKNTGCFKKQAMPYDEWTSYLFKNYNQLQDHFPGLKDSLYSYPFVYFSTANKHELRITDFIDTSLNSIQTSFHSQNLSVPYYYVNYTPQQIELNCNSKTACILNLQQTYYKGWKVFIDGKEVPFLWNSSLLMSVAIPKGTHLIRFHYNNTSFTYSLILSYGLLVLLLISLFILSSKTKIQKIIFSIILVLFTTLLIALLFHHKTKQNKTFNSFTFPGNKTLSLKLNNNQDIRSLWHVLETQKIETFSYSWENYYNSPELMYSLGFNPDDETLKNLSGQVKFSTSSQPERKILFTEKIDADYQDQTFIDTTDNTLKLEGKQNPFTKAQTIDLNQLRSKNIYGHVKLRSEKRSNPIVGCVIKTKKGDENQYYFALNKYLIANSKPQSIPFHFEISKYKLDEVSEIKLFLMNQAEQPVYVRQFEAACF